MKDTSKILVEYLEKSSLRDLMIQSEMYKMLPLLFQSTCCVKPPPLTRKQKIQAWFKSVLGGWLIKLDLLIHGIAARFGVYLATGFSDYND